MLISRGLPAVQESENVWADLEVCPDKAEFKALRCQIKTLRELLTQQESVVKTLQGQVEAEKAKTAVGTSCL